jgi:poly(hydroxyalkanoate) depolymerase family esterase
MEWDANWVGAIGQVAGAAVVCALVAATAAAAPESPSPTLTEMARFDDRSDAASHARRNPGLLSMFVYVPESVRTSRAPRPLVVALHGCAMTAEDYFLPTGWAQLAERWGFALLLPQQPRPAGLVDLVKGRNNLARCFQWWDADRGHGEVRSIMSMIRIMLDDHPESLDPARIYVTGVSAGGAMAVNLLALHPACFAGGAPVAGIPFDCAEGSVGRAVLDCMTPTVALGDRPRPSIDDGGRGLDAAAWGDRVRRVCGDAGDCPAADRGWPSLSIWQGAQDRMVGPGNMRDLRRQWTSVHGIDEVADEQATVPAAPYVVDHRQYADPAGRVRVETWLVGEHGPATDHGVVIDPEEPSFPCGRPQDFIHDGNICSTLQIARFWGLDRPADAGRAGGRCAALR